MRREPIRKSAAGIAAALWLSGVGPLLLAAGALLVLSGAALARDSSGFEPGESFVIRLGDGKHYYATVERRYAERGVEMLAYRWSDGSRFGQGYLPLAQRDESLFTLEQARRKSLTMVNERPAAQQGLAQGRSAVPAPADAPPRRGADPGADPPTGPLDREAQQEMVAAHNRWREQVGVADLGWSPKLATTAQDWAEHIAQTRNCRIDASAHSKRKDLGENLAYFSPIRYSDGTSRFQPVRPARVADSWASEKKNYDYASNSCSSVCGHYTQMVWQRTEQVGCGRAVCEDKSQVWVCNYSPPGNFVGQKPY